MVLDRYTYSRVADDLMRAASEHSSQPKVRLKIGPPSWEVAEAWGDTHFARAFAAELRQLGFDTAIDVLADWDARWAQDADVVVHFRGLMPYATKPAHVNVLWLISHPEDVLASELEQYDLIFVASEPYARYLATLTDIPVKALMQATDPDIFQPREKDPELASDVLFVGNSRGVLRRSLDWAIAGGVEVDVYGAGWSGLIPNDMVRAEHFPNLGLPHLYSSTSVLLNDHWDDMRDHGFISNRIFDALAAGVCVLSDEVAGLEEVFGDLVPVYSDPGSLKALVDRYLLDDSERSEAARKGREIILSGHTFAHRAAEFTEAVTPILDRKLKRLPTIRTDLS